MCQRCFVSTTNSYQLRQTSFHHGCTDVERHQWTLVGRIAPSHGKLSMIDDQLDHYREGDPFMIKAGLFHDISMKRRINEYQLVRQNRKHLADNASFHHRTNLRLRTSHHCRWFLPSVKPRQVMLGTPGARAIEKTLSQLSALTRWLCARRFPRPWSRPRNGGP